MSVRTSLLLIALAGSLSLAGGCASTSMHETWKSTKKLYTEYLNPPAAVDYEDTGSLSDAENALASRMLGIDNQLEQLERFLQNQDKPPAGEVIAQFFARFPWLSGLAAVDAEGNVHAQEPPVPMKPLDYAPIVEQQSREGDPRGIRAYVQDTPLGPEVFMGMPIYEDSELRGFLVCHFDMRALLKYTSSPEELVILSPEAVLWPGHFAVGATPLQGRKWDDVTRSSVGGIVSDSTGEFIWMARFIGRTPVIFASPVKGSFSEDTEPMKELESGYFGAPPDQTSPVTESRVIEDPDTSLLLAPLPPIRVLGPEETPIAE